MGWNYLSADWSYANGNAPSTAGLHGAIVCTARGNLGGFTLTSNGVILCRYAAGRGILVGGYFFNGNLPAFTCGVLFAQQALVDFTVGSSLVLIDNEDEGATGTHSWGPTEDIDFMHGVQSQRPDIPNSAFICYMNKVTNTRFNWTECVNLGMGLMYARPGGPMDYQWWPNPLPTVMKQDGTVNGADADYHDVPWPQIVGSGAPARKVKSSMATLYYTTVDDTPLGQVEAFHLAGDGIGEAAWLDIYDPQLANELAGFHSISQNSVFLTKATAADWQKKYTGGTPVSGASFTGSLEANIDVDKLAQAVGSAVATTITANNAPAASTLWDQLAARVAKG